MTDSSVPPGFVDLVQLAQTAGDQTWHSTDIARLATGGRIRFRVMRGTTAAWHRHPDRWECFLLMQGALSIDTENGSFDLEPGQFFAVRPGLRHRARTASTAQIVVIDDLTDPSHTQKDQDSFGD